MNLKTLFSAGALITVGMLTGRVLGLLRETLLASQFGVHTSADMAVILLIIPDFITAALIGSAASAALIPAFATRDHAGALALFWQALLVSVGAFAVIALAMFLEEDQLQAWMNPQIADVPQVSLAFFLTLCSLPISAATAVITAYLQYRGRFVAPAFANAVFNVGIILTLWLSPGGLALFAVGIIAATTARLGTHVGAFIRAGDTGGKPLLCPWQIDAPLAKAYGATASSGILGLLPYYAPYAVIAFAGSSVALFNYAFKLVLLPATLLQTILQMVLLPWFVKLRATEGAQPYSMSLQLAWIVALVMSMALSLVGSQVAALCFGYGKMTPEAIAQVGQLFALGVWAVPPMVLTCVWQQILYANKYTGAVLSTSALQAMLVVPLSWLGHRLIGPQGVLVAYIAVQAAPLWILAREGVKRGLVASLRPSWVYARMTLAALLAFLPLAWLQQSLALPAFASVMLACFIGIVSLGAGLLASQPVRQWAMQKVRP